jgi:hypothetical protein
MSNKTEGVKTLVRDALQTLPRPYGEDVIEDVCLAIEGNSESYRQYDQLCTELSKDVVNQWIGQYTRSITGLQTIREVKANRSKLIKDYTKLGS